MARMKEVQCADCGKMISISEGSYYDRLRKNKPFRCKECLRKYRGDVNRKKVEVMTPEERAAYSRKLSESNKQVWKEKSEEEKKAFSDMKKAQWAAKSDDEMKAFSELKRQQWIDLSDEEKQERIEHISEGTKKGMAKMSTESIEQMNHNRDNAMRNMTIEQKMAMQKKHSETLVKYWRSKSIEEKHNQSMLLNEGRELWWKSLSDADKIQWVTNLREGQEAWWTSLAEEEKNAHNRNVSVGLVEYWANKSAEYHRKHGTKISRSMQNRSIEAKLETANRMAEHDKDKTPGWFPQWFQTMFETTYGQQYQLYREEPAANSNVHRWDYMISSGQNVILIIDIDDTWSHGGGSTEYGRSSRHSNAVGREQYDAERGLTIPDGIPFMVISEEYKEKSFRDLVSMLGKSYEDYIQWMYKCLRTQPFPYPSYSNKWLLSSYNRIRNRLELHKKKRSMRLLLDHWDCLYGMHLVYHFYHSIWHDSMPGKMCPHDAYMDDDILMDMIRKRYIIHVRNRNKITQCFLLSEEAPRVPIFTPIMGMKVIHKYCAEYDTIVDCNTQYGGVLLATLAMDKKYIGYDNDLAHHNESLKLINWFPTVGISVDAKMLDHVPSGPCMCSYVPFGDGYIDELLQRTNCTKYVLVVSNTDKYTDNVVESFTTDDHWGERRLYIIILNKDPHG